MHSHGQLTTTHTYMYTHLLSHRAKLVYSVTESATLQAIIDYCDNETVTSPDLIHASSKNDKNYTTLINSIKHRFPCDTIDTGMVVYKLGYMGVRMCGWMSCEYVCVCLCVHTHTHTHRGVYMCMVVS